MASVGNTGNFFLDIRSIVPTGMSDWNTDDALGEQKASPGQMSFMMDRFGFKIMSYVKNQSGATVAAGDLLSRPVIVSVTCDAAGTTLTALKTAGWTAAADVGKIFYVVSNNDSSNAAPAGETSMVESNTADKLTLSTKLPLSAATANNDHVNTAATYQAIDSAAGDSAAIIQGVVMGANGFQDEQFGWVTAFGVCLARAKTLIAFPANTEIIAETAVVNAVTGGIEDWIGQCLVNVSADLTVATPACRINVLMAAGVQGTP